MVSLAINNQSALHAIGSAQAAGANLGPAFRAIAVRLQADTLRNFRQGGWFPGPAWVQSKRGGQTLVDNGILRNSIHGSSGADFARVGTDVLYAAAHQFGLPARKIVAKGRALRIPLPGGGFVFRKSAQLPPLPARPFLPVDSAGNLHPSTQQFIVDIIVRQVKQP